MKVFTISGKARHGKSTIADYIKEYYAEKSQKACIIPLARHIKSYAIDFFDWDGKEETKPRDLLIELGTEIIRIKMKKQMFHIDRTIEDIEILANYFDIFIVPDREAEKGDLNFVSLRYFNPAGDDFECEIGEFHDPETHLIQLVLELTVLIMKVS